MTVKRKPVVQRTNARRSARVPAAAKAKSPRPPRSRLDELGIDGLCKRLQAGESVTAIAQDLQIGKTTLLEWIALDPDRSARAREARSAAAAMYDEMAEQGLLEAADPFELAKAKERAHHLRWRASKVNPNSYGDKVQVAATVDQHTLSDEQLKERLAAFGINVAIGPKIAGASGEGDA